MKNLLLLFALFTATISANAQIKDEVINKATELSTDATKTVYSDAKDATVTVYNDGKSLVKQIYEDGKSLAPEIKSAFKSLADSFNTTVEKLWDILVRQQYVWSICYLIVLLLTLYGWWKFSKSFTTLTTDLTDTKEIKTTNFVYSAVLLCLSIYGSIHFIDNIDKMLTGFINPEFGAVRTIIEFIKG